MYQPSVHSQLIRNLLCIFRSANAQGRIKFANVCGSCPQISTSMTRCDWFIAQLRQVLYQSSRAHSQWKRGETCKHSQHTLGHKMFWLCACKWLSIVCLFSLNKITFFPPTTSMFATTLPTSTTPFSPLTLLYFQQTKYKWGL